MSNSYSKELLRTGIIEAKAGHEDTARRYLDRAIYMAGSHDVLAEAWYWMSEVLDDAAEKRKALENCLSHDLHHSRARRSLAILDGKIKADEIVNPDRLPAAPEGLRSADADRFMCPKCGGRMSFAPDGSTLVCDYCTRQHALGLGAKREDEKDFIVAMATMKGHGKPLQEQAFHCNGCGAEFILPPKQLSADCAYCDSPHVVKLENSKDLLAPDAIIPHAFDQKRAVQLLIEWVEGNGIKPEKQVELPRGLYLPMWTFDIGGEIDYTAEIVEYEERTFSNKRERKVVRINDKYPVLVDDLPLPASRKLSAVFSKLIPTFDIKSLQPYDARYLASWPAEIYDVPMADASLDARSQAYKQLKRDIPARLGGVNIVHTSSAGIMISSFKLNLLPVWMTEIPFDGREHLLLINGKNGHVASDLPEKEEEEEGGLFSFLADLLGE
jgi:DNA-directed RNA polymerase subunit RPC12/RpoP